MRDRTAEYLATLNALHTQLQTAEHDAVHSARAIRSGLLAPPHADVAQPPHSGFAASASRVAKNLTTVAEQLQRLTTLSRERSSLADQTAEVNRLSAVVKRDLKGVESDIDLLQAAAQQQRGGRQSAESTRAVLDSLRRDLAGNVRSFSDVLHIRTKKLRDELERRREFGRASAITQARTDPFAALALDALPARTHAEARTGPDQAAAAGAGAGAGAGAASRLPDVLPLSSHPELQEHLQMQMQQQQQQQQPRPSGDALWDEYMSQRQREAELIEEQFRGLTEQFTRFAHLLAAQDDVIIRVDEWVSQAHGHVIYGEKQIEEHEREQPRTQLLLVQVFAALIVFAVGFVVFVA